MLTQRSCQDLLENCFGRQKLMDWCRDNPKLRTSGCQDNTASNSKNLLKYLEVFVEFPWQK